MKGVAGYHKLCRLFGILMMMFFLAKTDAFGHWEKEQSTPKKSENMRYKFPVNAESQFIIQKSIQKIGCNFTEYLQMWGVNVDEGETYRLNCNKSFVIADAGSKNAQILMILLSELNVRSHAKEYSVEELVEVYSFEKKIEGGKVLDRR